MEGQTDRPPKSRKVENDNGHSLTVVASKAHSGSFFNNDNHDEKSKLVAMGRKEIAD